MITPFPTLPLLPLVLSWFGEPGTTYTCQVSGDLEIWESLPVVIEGGGLEVSLEIDDPRNPVFARLRFSPDGDTDENGLADAWELDHFGRLEIDPDADPDQDGLSNFREWQEGSDPLDFFNGQIPLLHIACGEEWLLPAGSISSQSVTITVCHPSGEPWPGAPVEMYAMDGAAGLLHPGQTAAEAVTGLALQTDPNGRLPGGDSAIHLLAPTEAPVLDQIHIACGKASGQLWVRSMETDFGPPPRRLQSDQTDLGETRVRWAGDPGAASSFLVEELDVSGQWVQLALVDIALIGDPDPDTGLYEWIIR